MIALLIRVAAVLSVLASARAAETRLKFALIPDSVGNWFSDQVMAGCKAAERELNGVECIYVGPTTPADVLGQVTIVEDVISRKIDGIAIAPSNPDAVVPALQRARAAGIPVVTWDTDLNERDWSLRVAHLGTNDFQVGVGLARLLRQLKPNGGSICIVIDIAGMNIFDARLKGIRDTLAGSRSAEVQGRRLAGQNGWVEPDNCPIDAKGNVDIAYHQLDEVLGKPPTIDAFVMTGSLLQSDPKAYEAMLNRYRDKITSGALVFIGAGISPSLPKSGSSRAGFRLVKWVANLSN